MIDVPRISDAAVARIRPLVEASRYRLDGIPSSIWLEPYMVGLLGMLITLVAEHEKRAIKQAAMQRIQSVSWRAITGLEYRIGEEIMLLSSSHNADFLEGCMDATKIAAELIYDNAGSSAEAPDLGDLAVFGDRGPAAAIPDIPLWRDAFDSYIARRQ